MVCGDVCSQLSVQPVFASPPAYCFEHDCAERFCDNNPAKGTATCCWKEPGVIPRETKCQTCHVNTSTGEFENCTSVLSKGRADSSIIAPPHSGVAPPPSTETCPENTALDAKGNCTPLTQTPEEPSPPQPTELIPQVDCTQTPDNPLCETAVGSEGSGSNKDKGDSFDNNNSGDDLSNNDGN